MFMHVLLLVGNKAMLHFDVSRVDHMFLIRYSIFLLDFY